MFSRFLLTTMPPGPGPDLFVDVGSVFVDAAEALGHAGQGDGESRASSVIPLWLRGICLASDKCHADGQRDQGEDHDDELLKVKLFSVFSVPVIRTELKTLMAIPVYRPGPSVVTSGKN